MGNLPDLSTVFGEYDTGDDHASDGCCLSLRWDFFPDDEARWAEVRDQHLAAFLVLAGTAAGRKEGQGGWFVGRPLLFAAHHVVELTLKTATVSEHTTEQGVAPSGHELGPLLKIDRQLNGVREASAEWEDEFVRLLEKAWEAGRYPVNRKGAPLFDDVCCASTSELRRAVVEFVALIEAITTEELLASHSSEWGAALVE